jgi:hypothetical protein
MVYSGFTSQLGLRYRMGLRTLAGRVGYGLGEWALGIVATVFANIRGFSDAFECILYFRCMTIAPSGFSTQISYVTLYLVEPRGL